MPVFDAAALAAAYSSFRKRNTPTNIRTPMYELDALKRRPPS